MDRHWVRCRSETREGSIPCSHVSEATGIGRLSDGQDVFVVSSDFDGEQAGDLALRRGTLVVSTARVDDHWSRGRAVFPDGSFSTEGVFPPAFCWRLDSARLGHA